MKRFQNKIAGEGGASILYAMMFLMVGFMVSAVILAAATSSLSRIHDDQVWHQDRLMLNSAGELLRELLNETSFEVVKGIDDDGNQTVAVTGTGPLANTLKQSVEETATRTDGTATSQRSFTLEVSGVSDSKVWVYYTMHSIKIDSESGKPENPDDRCRIEATLQLSQDYVPGDQRLYVSAYDPKSGDTGEENDEFIVKWEKGDDGANVGISLSTIAPEEDAS